jgi:flagellar assembly factor FliW
MQLRSNEQAMLGFVVLPVPAELRLLAQPDLEAVCDDLDIDVDDLLLLLMVTLQPEPDGLAAFANLRAPLFVDTERRLGWQVVLPATGYPIRYPLQAPR